MSTKKTYTTFEAIKLAAKSRVTLVNADPERSNNIIGFNRAPGEDGIPIPDSNYVVVDDSIEKPVGAYEAIKALLEGKRVRPIHWHQDTYVEFDENHNLTGNVTGRLSVVLADNKLYVILD